MGRSRQEKLYADLIDIGTMITKIFHPNISKSGEICVDTLKKSWKKEYGVSHVLVVSPEPDHPLQRTFTVSGLVCADHAHRGRR